MSSSSADVETHAILLSRLNETLHQLNGELKSLRSSKHPVGNVDNSHNPLTPLKSNEIARQATANIDTTMRLQGTSSSSLLAPSQITTKSGNSPLLTSENTSKGIKKKALIFTMDSIPTYEENSLSGGAAGELLIRHSLEAAFKHFNVDVRVIKSDREFEESNAKVYDFIILDPWTWAAKGWVPKKVIRGLDDKIFILDFFGSEGLRGNELKIPKSRILTAYGSPWNTFLGYFIDESKIPPPTSSIFKYYTQSKAGCDMGQRCQTPNPTRAIASTTRRICPLGIRIYHACIFTPQREVDRTHVISTMENLAGIIQVSFRSG